MIKKRDVRRSSRDMRKGLKKKGRYHGEGTETVGSLSAKEKKKKFDRKRIEIGR